LGSGLGLIQFVLGGLKKVVDLIMRGIPGKKNNERAIAQDGTHHDRSAWFNEQVCHDTQHVRVVDHAHVTDPVDLDIAVTSRFLSQASLPGNHAVSL
jgi:hypothetical protein